ncbi:MAG: DUF4263 domain-containing protein [Opitutaceae bacterium]|jgi:hypothetical protein|nr:DUF4263 domain-containing protein [Opitutaceae bacterium]
MKTNVEQLEEILSQDDGERALCTFLKENPYILRDSLQYLGNPSRVIAEFPLGTEYYADFVVIAPFSGAIEIRFIEVEPPASTFFNRDFSLAQRTNKAVEQINSWKIYVEKNRPQLIRDLERYAKKKDLIREHSEDEELTCTAGWNIHNPRMSLYFSYTILMGRRSSLTDEMLERKASFDKNMGVSLVSCDRLIGGASKIDLNPHIYEK